MVPHPDPDDLWQGPAVDLGILRDFRLKGCRLPKQFVSRPLTVLACGAQSQRFEQDRHDEQHERKLNDQSGDDGDGQRALHGGALPQPAPSGSSARMAAKVVMAMGRMRLTPASTTAARGAMPSRVSCSYSEK